MTPPKKSTFGLDNDHLAAIGEFITTYSFVEYLFHLIFAGFAGLKPEMARAVTGGMRVKDVIDRIKRVIKFDPPRLIFNDQPHDLAVSFFALEAAFNEIAPFRDKLMHRVWLGFGDIPSLHNLAGAKSIEAIVPERIPTDEIRRKTAALEKVMWAAGAHCIFHLLRHRDDLSDEELKVVLKAALQGIPSVRDQLESLRDTPPKL